MHPRGGPKLVARAIRFHSIGQSLQKSDLRRVIKNKIFALIASFGEKDVARGAQNEAKRCPERHPDEKKAWKRAQFEACVYFLLF